jgi:uncharacterized membrane protein
MDIRLQTPALSHTVRRDEPTRLEGFSDTVFGLSLALLAFSLDVPTSVEELRVLTIAQFVPTLAAFALMCWIWAEHNSFFRQFGLQDATTIILNCALLFLVVFYTYPLKFMAVYLWGLIAHGLGWSGIESAMLSSGSLRTAAPGSDFPLMVIYNIGFIALFSIFALLYRHALRQQDVLALDEVALFDARAGQRGHLVSIAIGLVAVVVMLMLPRYLAGLSGAVYMLMGPAHGIQGARSGRARARLIEARQAALSAASEDEPAI